MGQPFQVEYPIRFSHCDPAGIVYFPRFFDLLHHAMEDWFTHGLGERFSALVMEKGLGTPTVVPLSDGSRAEISVQRMRSPGGTSLLGSGVPPDHLVPPDPQALAAGRDPALDAAIALLP